MRVGRRPAGGGWGHSLPRARPSAHMAWARSSLRRWCGTTCIPWACHDTVTNSIGTHTQHESCWPPRQLPPHPRQEKQLLEAPPRCRLPGSPNSLAKPVAVLETLRELDGHGHDTGGEGHLGWRNGAEPRESRGDRRERQEVGGGRWSRQSVGAWCGAHRAAKGRRGSGGIALRTKDGKAEVELLG